MTITGYARTSTADQVAGLDDQIATLLAAGCAPDRIWREQVSSVDRERPQLVAALAWLREGDTFVVTKPDRLARSVADMLKIVDTLAARGVTMRILSMGVDTSTSTGELILNVLASVAQWERKIMLERQRAGIAKAKADGKYRGRKRKVDRIQALIWKAEGVPIAEIARRMSADPTNVRKALKS